MVLDAVQPAAGNYSIYQVESVWTNQVGLQFPLNNLAGKPQIVAMTYTSCEVSCPRIVSVMQQIGRETQDLAGFTLISIDPDRDTVQQLAGYAAKMNLDASSWNLLRGEPEDVLEMAALLGVRYQKMPDGEFAHSNMITVLNEMGVIVHQQGGLAPDLNRETVEFVREMLLSADS